MAYSEDNCKDVTFVTINLANAVRDTPLGSRMPEIIGYLKWIRSKYPKLVVFFLEANRPGKVDPTTGVPLLWANAAQMISEVGFVYNGCVPHNDTEMSMGIAVFTVGVDIAKLTHHILDPEGFRNVGVCVDINGTKVMVTQLPLNRDRRLHAVSALCKLFREGVFDIVCGDFNKFPDDESTKVLNTMFAEVGLSNRIPEGAPTFCAFPGDEIPKPADTSVFFDFIDGHDSSNAKIRVASDLDAIFALTGRPIAQVSILPPCNCNNCLSNGDFPGYCKEMLHSPNDAHAHAHAHNPFSDHAIVAFRL